MQPYDSWRERAISEAGLRAEDESLLNLDTFTPTADNRSALKAAKDFVTEYQAWRENGGIQIPGPFMLLYGPAGVGKTHLCNGIAWRFLDLGERVKYWQAEALFDDLRASYERGNYERTMKHLLLYGLVIIDDVGAQTDTPWSMAKLDMIVDHRYRYRLPTVLTTNTLDLPARIADRLKEGRIRQIKGESWRGVKP